MIGFLRRTDWMIVLFIMLLLTISCLFIYSADYRSAEGNSNSMLIRQAVWVLIGLACYIAAAAFDYRRLRSFHWWIYGGTLATLVAVLFIGTSVYGANRWFSIGGFMVQPSEFGKLAVMITLAAWLSDPSTDIDELPTFFKAFVLVGLPFLLIVIEPDLGTAMVLLPVIVIMLFCSGIPLRPLLILIGVGALALTLLIIWLRFFPDTCPFLTDYQKNRILVYLNVSQDPLGAGWNKLQSQIAVGSGGMFGKGWLKGTQNILGFLPRKVAPTDFIYSVVAEETGFAGSSLLLALYAGVTIRCMRAAIRARDLFGRLLATGVGTIIFTHVFINIAMTVGLMPITGLPLPLMSYGGSFMVSTMTALGLVQGVYLRRRI
jgi:rod shape determining protein RodA